MPMEDVITAKLTNDADGQTLHIPDQYALAARQVRISRHGKALLVEPADFDVKAWFAKIDEYGDEPFLPDGVKRPGPPPPENIFDE